MSQKLEDLLNLAIQTPEETRSKTDTLNVGFDAETKTWELIVKYHGDLSFLEGMGIVVEYLIAGYAILTVPENLVEKMADMEQIEYVEKPKPFFYSDVEPASNSCLPFLTMREPFLHGKGILIAILDSGISYQLKEFRKENGDTRICYLWDQSLRVSNLHGVENKTLLPPDGFSIGVEFSEAEINEALREPSRKAQYEILPSIDLTGHGTAVAGIAAGYNKEEGYVGVATEASLLIVKLGIPKEEGFPRTTEIMRGVTYSLRKAEELKMPLVINLSFGNSYGSHDGSSLLERFLDNASEIGKTVICVGSGNEGASGGHFSGNVETTDRVQLAIADYEKTLSVQLWKHYTDSYRIFLRSPSGRKIELTAAVESGKYVLQVENTRILVYLGEPLPYSVTQEIYFEMIPIEGTYINSGIWEILIEPITVVVGEFDLYLPSSGARNSRTKFYRATPQASLTIPSTAAKVITVGAYDAIYHSYADFSGRGYGGTGWMMYSILSRIVKPDLVAPGVGIRVPDTMNGYQSVSGTSFSTPIVSGSAAMLMEWGIIRGNDPFLYGEKVKAYLRAGAEKLRGERDYPNDKVGYGSLCVADSIP